MPFDVKSREGPSVRLFERLSSSVDHQRVGEDKSRNLMASIKSHLMCILNTYVGSSESAPLLGLNDFNDALQDGIDLGIRIKTEIEKCVASFEPRVSNVSVESTFNDGNLNPMNLQFRICATLLIGREEAHATISLLLNERHFFVLK